MSKRPRGRPKNEEPNQVRSLRLTDAEWAALTAIAEREGLTGLQDRPSPSRAVVWLLEQDHNRQDESRS